MHVKPLKFNDPEIERRTYVDAMSATLVDLSDGNFSLDNAIAILKRYGYDNSSIARYVDAANQKAIKCVGNILSK